MKHNVRFKAKLGDHEIEGDVVNPGDWFGRVWVIEIGMGCSSCYLAVEADDESAAIDALADSDEYSSWIAVAEADCPKTEAEEEKSGYVRAGNDGHFVDLESVLIHDTKSKVKDLRYHRADFPDGIDPKDHHEWDFSVPSEAVVSRWNASYMADKLLAMLASGKHREDVQILSFLYSDEECRKESHANLHEAITSELEGTWPGHRRPKTAS
jgi:hypothetical protein